MVWMYRSSTDDDDDDSVTGGRYEHRTRYDTRSEATDDIDDMDSTSSDTGEEVSSEEVPSAAVSDEPVSIKTEDEFSDTSAGHAGDAPVGDADNTLVGDAGAQPLVKDEVQVKPETDPNRTVVADTTAPPDEFTYSTSASLQELVRETNADSVTAEKLEAGASSGLRLLDQLNQALQAGLEHNHADVQHWIKQIDTVRAEAKQTRTIIGVVGNTGAGKSSVVNAVLEEERIVPTNCMRACTAVVTEMSYNDSEDEASKYRAEIEFIKAEDWEKELHVLYLSLIHI